MSPHYIKKNPSLSSCYNKDSLSVWCKLILSVVGDLAKRKKIPIHNRQFECLVDFSRTFNNLRLSLFPPLWHKIAFTACHRRDIKLRGCVRIKNRSLKTLKTRISRICRKNRLQTPSRSITIWNGQIAHPSGVQYLLTYGKKNKKSKLRSRVSQFRPIETETINVETRLKSLF